MNHWSLVRQRTAEAPSTVTELPDPSPLLRRLGFEERVRGSHHVFRKAGIEERGNLQRDAKNAKPYQVRQVRAVFLKYRLGGEL